MIKFEATHIGEKTIADKHMQRAQQKVLHQLVQAVFREGLADYHLVNDGESLLAVLPCSPTGKIIIPIANTYLLKHVEIQGAILSQTETGITKITHPMDFLERLNLNEDTNQFEGEIENSVLNYALAFEGEERRKAGLSWKDDTFSFLEEKKKDNPMFSPLVFGEQWVIDGHTMHPCSKTRMGLSEEEVMQYSPEWGSVAKLIPLAIHKENAFMASMDESSMTSILLEEHRHVKEVFMEELPDSGRDYELIPVHPWQFEHTIKRCFKKEIEDKVIVPLIKAEIDASALLSFRSLAPASGMGLHHIKTAVDIQMTSAKRIVSPASIKNGPVISRVLKQVQTEDPIVGKAYEFLAEKAGGHFLPQRRENRSFLMKNLSAFIRENPEKNLGQEEIAVPSAFLISRSPFSDKMVLHELVERYSRVNDLDIKTGASLYIQSYAVLLLPGLLQLMTKYGISLEAHLQNTVAVFKQGVPVRFLFRDNGGIRIMEDRFCQHFPDARIDNSTNLLTNDNEDLTNMFSHALLHNHLGEMIHLLSKELDMDETFLWEPVRRLFRSTFTMLKKQKTFEESVMDIEKILTGPYAPLKALVRMRLDDRFTENVYVSVPNPLADGKESESFDK